MTLREEIYYELGNHENITDRIIEIFEKLIDSLYTTGKLGNNSTEAYYAIKEELKK